MIEGDLNAINKKFAIVASRWNPTYTEPLLEGALTTLQQNGASPDSLTIVRVTGAFEIPVVCRELARTGNFSAIITIGTLIKGETSHYKLICEAVTQGISAITRETGVPITLGIITAKDETQAAERAGGELGNLGVEAARAAIELANVITELRAHAL